MAVRCMEAPQNVFFCLLGGPLEGASLSELIMFWCITDREMDGMYGKGKKGYWVT